MIFTCILRGLNCPSYLRSLDIIYYRVSTIAVVMLSLSSFLLVPRNSCAASVVHCQNITIYISGCGQLHTDILSHARFK